MRLAGRRGHARLRFDPAEADLLSALFDQLDAVLDEDADDPVQRRLFPSAYPDDEQAAADFRTLTEASLREQRDERIAACRADLAGAGDIDLADPDTGRRWLQTLNDLRLALGTRLGITEDDDHGIDHAAPDAEPRTVYFWLTAVQDAVVTAVMR